MFLIVTGGIGSGKTFVSTKIASKLGWPLYSIDKVINELYFHPLVSSMLKKRYGTSDKAKISNLVLKDVQNDEVKWLEDLFAPFILPVIKKWCENTNAIIEFPLWFEKNGEEYFKHQRTFVVSIIVGNRIRIERVVRRMLPKSKAEAEEIRQKVKIIINRQVSDRVRATRSDHIIYNNDIFKSIDKEIDHLVSYLLPAGGPDSVLKVAKKEIKAKKLASRKTGVVAGSFDPITNGHLWIIEKALDLVDDVLIVVAHNPLKKYMFFAAKRCELIEKVLNRRFKEAQRQRIKILQLDNGVALTTFAREHKAKFIFRGICNFTDFEYENQLNLVQRKLEPDVETVYLIPPRELTEVSSSLVKGMLGLRGWERVARDYIPPDIIEALGGSKCKN